jgi:hypothetical protein
MAITFVERRALHVAIPREFHINVNRNTVRLRRMVQYCRQRRASRMARFGSGTSSTMQNRDAKSDYGSSTMIEAMIGEPAAS